jgi:hypothetical protein
LIGSLHSHPHEELIYVTLSRIRVTAEGTIFEAMEASSFIVACGVDHQTCAVLDAEVLDVFAPYRETFVCDSECDTNSMTGMKIVCHAGDVVVGTVLWRQIECKVISRNTTRHVSICLESSGCDLGIAFS